MTFPWTTLGHQIFRWVLIVQWVATIGIGVFTGEVISAAIVGLLIVSAPLILSFTQPNKPISAHAIAIAIQLMAALHIHQAYGLVEVHFELFALLAILAVFRDWKVVLTSVLTIAVHHILFYFLQLNNTGFLIFSPDNISFGILLIHAFFAVGEGVILMFMAKKAFQEGVGAILLSDAIKKIVHNPEQLDLTVHLDTRYPLLQPLAELTTKLKALISVSNLTAVEVNNASAQILIATQELTRSITERSEEISEISHASTEISKKIKETTLLTEDASTRSSDTKARSQNTFESVTSTNELISSLRARLNSAAQDSKELSQWSSSISNAMTVITSISDQTNLLALNAAIESARAGEHGRGFAVVAEEVRNLAIKSKQNAEEISDVTGKLVENTDATLESMEYCVELVDKTVNASESAATDMKSIIESVTQVAEHMTTISEAAEYQNTTSNTIANRTDGVQKGVEHEVVISEELEAQVSSLSALSEQMKTAALRFKIE